MTMAKTSLQSELTPLHTEPLLELSIGEQLRAQSSRFPEHPALIWAPNGDPCEVDSLTYEELLRAAETSAATIAKYGNVGDRVAIWGANTPEWVVAEYACALTGMVLTPFNTAWTDAEVEYALDLTRPRLLLAGPNGRGTDLSDRATTLTAIEGSCKTLPLADIEIHPAVPIAYAEQTVDPGAPFLVQFTSGTTGRAKGATLSHHSALNAGYIRALTVGADETDVWLNPVPLHHVGGSVIMVLAPLTSGGSYVVMPRFDPVKQVTLMRTVGATRTGGVPTMFYGLLEQPGGEDAMTAVRSIGLGGTSVPASLIERLQALDATVSVAFAQSECPMITSSDPAGDATHIATTVGITVPNTELRVVDSTNQVVTRGEVGEVCVRSPITMLGYWDMPEATAEVFDADGFLHTGDLGSIDDEGVLRIHGRARELIIRGGENIYPSEIEDVLLRHPAVSAVAVLATPSQRWGEEVGAVVQLAAETSVTSDELTQYVAAVLAHFKVPRHWRFIDSFPLTASGKIRKVDLVALFDEATP
jgi:fatty-acyl-CoA synthase